MQNDNFLHALGLTEVIFRHVNHTFRMLTGCGGDGFVECLKDSFEGMLVRLSRNGGKAKIITVKGAPENVLLDQLGKTFPNTLEVIHAKSLVNRVSHFIVGDVEMVRDASTVNAKMFFHSPAIAELLSDRFDALWGHLSEAAKALEQGNT